MSLTEVILLAVSSEIPFWRWKITKELFGWVASPADITAAFIG